MRLLKWLCCVWSALIVIEVSHPQDNAHDNDRNWPSKQRGCAYHGSLMNANNGYMLVACFAGQMTSGAWPHDLMTSIQLQLPPSEQQTSGGNQKWSSWMGVFLKLHPGEGSLLVLNSCNLLFSKVHCMTITQQHQQQNYTPKSPTVPSVKIPLNMIHIFRKICSTSYPKQVVTYSTL